MACTEVNKCLFCETELAFLKPVGIMGGLLSGKDVGFIDSRLLSTPCLSVSPLVLFCSPLSLLLLHFVLLPSLSLRSATEAAPSCPWNAIDTVTLPTTPIASKCMLINPQ